MIATFYKMPAAKVKTITKKSSLGDLNQNEIARMFEELIGTNRVDLIYALPKFKEMARRLKLFCAAGQGLTDKYFFGDIDSYNQFVVFQGETINTFGLIDRIPKFSAESRILGKYEEKDIIEFTKIYNEFRDSNVIKQITISASLLKSSHKDLIAKKPDFIYKDYSSHFCPLVFCPNFNILVMKELSPDDQRLKSWITYLKLLYELAQYLVEEMQKPDIDIQKFCSTVIQILTAAEKEEGLRGCKKAFDKIKESMHLLQDNFGKYYKEFINADKNSTTIFVSFIKDVTEQNADAEFSVISQFTKILNYYVKQMEKSGMKMSPEMQQATQMTIEQLKSFSNRKGAKKEEGEGKSPVVAEEKEE